MNNDIVINDSSASEVHASINYIGGEYYLKDENSKFGTYIMCTESVRIKADSCIWIQIGNTMMNIKMNLKIPSKSSQVFSPSRDCEEV